MSNTHVLKTRQQLIKYITSFKVPQVIATKVPEARRTVEVFSGGCFTYHMDWDMTWLRESGVKGLLALIEVLEQDSDDIYV